jgi:hypothetical protein
MSNPGKVIQITARPAEAAGLALEVDGIVEARTVQLGDSVTAFDFAGFYAILGSTITSSPHDPSHGAQLRFTSQGIRSHGPVASSALLALRTESLKAALDQAILARENAFYNKYGRSAAIVGAANKKYSQSHSSKAYLLSTLSQLSQQRSDLLQAAYERDERTGVVEFTTSQLIGYGSSAGSSDAISKGNERIWSKESRTDNARTDSGSKSGYYAGQPGDSVAFPQIDRKSGHLEGTEMDAITKGDSKSTVDTVQSGDSLLTTDITQTSEEEQTVINTGYDYHVPSIEAKAQHVRAQISLIDEQYDHFIDMQKMSHLQQIFANELKMIDLDVKQLQVAYLNTILLSPINGVVTGVFADAGDSVRAGEVLVRVENNMRVLLEATLVYRGSVSVGDTATVQTDLFSKPANSVSISGKIIAARGNSDDDRWNIVVSCDNRTKNGKEILPLHYSFDHDDTSITIS